MKILAIRGMNLASLAGEFVIDFRTGPLASAGLFAISGPTGAGKSTLLDALCLALYDGTPRLVHAAARGVGLPDVAGETITPQDARNLLRRGASEGFAEVDFVGNDGESYRARWSVRRAAGRTTGRLQKTEMSLERLSNGQKIGSTKIEILEEIRKRLGLTFQQFTRAVLLAQNEFGAFLKAPDDERASLLETLTGTDQYTRFSRRAFERAKAELEQLNLLQVQLADQQPLDEVSRKDLEARQVQSARVLHEKTRLEKTLDGQVQWHRRLEQLKQAETQAAETLNQAEIEHAAAGQRRTHLALVETVQDARGAVAESDRANREWTESQEDVARAEAALAAAVEKEREALAHQKEAEETVERAVKEKQAASRDLHRARALETEIGTLEPDHVARRNGLEALCAEETKLRERLAGKTSEQQQSLADLRNARQWLADHADLEPLGMHWARWDTLLSQAAGGQLETGAAREALEQAERALAERKTALGKADALKNEAETQYEKAREDHRAVEKSLAAYDAEELLRDSQGSRKRREDLVTGQSAWLSRQKLRSERLTQQSKQAQTENDLRQRQADLNATRQTLPALAAGTSQAERVLEVASVACTESVEQLRATLEEGEAYPVCGATDHPYRTGDHPLRNELSKLRGEVDACRLELKAQEENARRLAFEVESLGRQLDESTESLRVLEKSIEEAQATYEAEPLAGELAPIGEADRENWLAEEIQRAEARLRDAEESMKAMNEAAARRDAARKALDAAGESREQALNACAAEKAAFRDAEMNVQSEAGKLRDVQTRLEGYLEKLDPAFESSDWRSDWSAGPEEFHRRCETMAREWIEKKQSVDGLEKSSEVLAVEIKERENHAEKMAEQRRAAEAHFEKVEGTLSEKRRERAGLFGGRPIADVESDFDRAVDAARGSLEKFAAATRQAQQVHARTLEALDQKKGQLSSREQAAGKAEAALDAWIAAFNAAAERPLDRVGLKDLLTHDTSWISAERQDLKKLDEAVHAGQTLLRERRAQRETHVAEWPTPEPLDRVQADLSALRVELDEVKNQDTEINLRLREDDRRRQTSAELVETLTRQQAIADTWTKLNDLIGSADGKKFRNIAQQITLDILLGYANRHLKDLTRRYRLERIKDTLALQVVDQDMGDEIRSVHSLSGGESFLVSLALALGLASLSSNRVRVESLFIDEGFGSLDADTLRMAMDALDSLQSLGRKVGVISHVQEMTERIGTRIQVTRSAGGQSKVTVVGQ